MGKKALEIELEALTDAPEIVRKPGQVQVSDFQLLTGALVQVGSDGRIYDTAKGRLLKQLYKDTAFRAFRAHRKATDTGETPVHDVQAAKLLALEESTSPFKDGIDSHLGDVITIDPLITHRPRSNLLFDILFRVDSEEGKVVEQVATLKQLAMQEQASSMATKDKKTTPLGVRSYQRRIAEGLTKLIEDDGEFDALFLTKACQFVVDYPNKVTTEEDDANIGIIQAALDFTGESATTPEVVGEITFDV